MNSSSYILNDRIPHEFNKTSRLLTVSMLFALIVSAAANIYPLFYFSDLNLFSSKPPTPQTIKVVLLPTQKNLHIHKPTVSASSNRPVVKTTTPSEAGAVTPSPATASSKNSLPQNKGIYAKPSLSHTNDLKKTTAKSSRASTSNTKNNRSYSSKKPKKAASSAIKTSLKQARARKNILNKKLSIGIQPLYKLTIMPAFAHKERPTYPETERKLGTESVVIAAATIDNKGIVKQVQIVQTGGSNFDSAVVNALYKSNFYPAYIDDLAVATRLQIPYEFELQ